MHILSQVLTAVTHVSTAVNEALMRGEELQVGNYLATCVSVVNKGVATISVLRGKNIPDKARIEM